MSAIPSDRFQVCLSLGLYTEWQAVLTRPEHLPPGRNAEAVLRYLRFLASHAHLQDIHFLWRPWLPDAGDDLVLELAFAAGCQYIVTHNERDFVGTEAFGLTVLSPREFLPLVRRP